jgi:hypothetical protein
MTGHCPSFSVSTVVHQDRPVSDRLGMFAAIGSPFVRRRVTLPDGGRLSWSVRLERNAAGHFAVEGQAFDGWCDSWPLTDELYGRLVARGLSARSVRLVHTVLRQALADAESKRMIPSNPAATASPPRRKAARRRA